jgi:hypothetical protein
MATETAGGTLKKVTVGIKKDRMVNAWQRMGLCDEHHMHS